MRRDLLGRALADGSGGALILFLARYPDGPDAGTVRAALAARRQADPAPVGGPDGDIVAGFDRARLDGPATLDAFAARYPNHPLAAEARRAGVGGCAQGRMRSRRPGEPRDLTAIASRQSIRCLKGQYFEEEASGK